MININKFFEAYEKEMAFVLSQKQKILESFKKKEEKIKLYEEALGELEKVKNEINFDLFKKETEEFISVLMNFDTENIEKNTEMVYSSIAYMGTIRKDLEEVSKKYLHIKNFWENYAIKKYKIEKNAKFAQDIDQELKEISIEIQNVTIDEIQRLEDRIESAKTKIERSVSMINDLNRIMEDHIFIGEAEIAFKQKIENFIENQYKTLSLTQVSELSEEIKNEFKVLKKESKTIRKKIPLYRIFNNTGKVHSFAMEPKEGVKINVSDIEIENPIYKKEDRYIYIDNYPIHGIFEKNFLKEEMEIPDEHFDAIKEFDRVSTTYFMIFTFLSLITIFLNIFNVIPLLQTIALVMLYPLLFIVIFKKTKKTTDKRFKLPLFFHFFETNFYIVKEGDNLFKPQNVIPMIFLHFEKLFKV